jgi:hypothetical protein
MHQPLLTREQVNQQLGFEGFGVLQMVVHLPGAKEPLYCFKSTKALGKGNAEVDYRFATPAQLDRMRTAANQATWDEVYEGMIHLNSINTGETKVGSNGTQVTLGRDHWLPGRAGEDHAESPKSSVPSGMEKVAATQLELRIDDVNDLVVHNLATPYDYKMDIDTKHAQPAAVIEVNPTLILAQDEWSHAPINVGRYVLPE